MKFNWGTGIILVYAIFATVMVSAVIRSRKYDPGLMQKDYYNLDLNYQERLVKKQNTASLDSLPVIHFDVATRTVQVLFPASMPAPSGTAKCYRSATIQEDFTTDIQNTRALSIPATTLTPGRWHIELDWESNGKCYFYENTFIVPNA